MFEYLLIEIENFVATITINRPEQRNAMNPESWAELHKAIRQLNEDENVRVIIITGAGDKAFVAGADIKWLHDRKPLDIYGLSVQDVLMEIFRSYKPVIAAINGYALGGGCELVLACDIRIASDQAKFGQPEIKLGILPAGGGTQQLTKSVGLVKAKEMILTGSLIDAKEAYEYGLINHVVAHDQVMNKAREIAETIAHNPPVAVRLAKIALNESATADFSSGLALEKALQAVLFGTKDKHEGTKAFLEKRTPEYVGE
ncbi:enoyl-CoA hydratase/isomerase family protein [Brevibacillus daliensis]|uniref:enoyl-CoA hydratase/isomerase family protein n=1 Tax=Brevibacillus daliensis TaxID=2892995 RepID=UPI0021045605|nr:enoyl-CoA hydratase-related protein [Brevibacillus daliensis]